MLFFLGLLYILFRASCRIRTNDPEITNHVLWPTELKRRVGKLTISRRYNQLPLLRSSPGGFEGSWPYRTYPFFGCKGRHFYGFCNSYEQLFSSKTTNRLHFKQLKVQKKSLLATFIALLTLTTIFPLSTDIICTFVRNL